MITVFWRTDVGERDEECDVASVPVYSIDDDSPHGFIGSAWGEHKPTDVIDYATCEPAGVDDLLLSWGVERRAWAGPEGSDA